MFYWWPEFEPGSTLLDVLERAIERNETAAANYSKRLVEFGESNEIVGQSDNRERAIACYAAADVLTRVRSLLAPSKHPSPRERSAVSDAPIPRASEAPFVPLKASG